MVPQTSPSGSFAAGVERELRIFARRHLGTVKVEGQPLLARTQPYAAACKFDEEGTCSGVFVERSDLASCDFDKLNS